MTTIRFLHPELAWWMLAVLAVCFAIRRWRTRRRYVASTAVDRIAGRSYAPSALRRLPAFFVVMSLGLIGGALMDPVLPYADADVTSRCPVS